MIVDGVQNLLIAWLIVLQTCLLCPQVVISLGSGPWDQLFVDSDSPAFTVAVISCSLCQWTCSHLGHSTETPKFDTQIRVIETICLHNATDRLHKILSCQSSQRW
ncbi:uncharacterized protein LOC112514041 isoform X2 [Cynara cardunculus var. scolymus]|uniref:uncharacterized protein LOC112514041 isoform X2 n=1 Tax=Cynara cardunculus var. scolymus TaxID=59895 RepID=UPI000D62FED3|nr:uncharacterized protein LOC112514041 isoform X2 [Cynara cardunculus var. scolymus]